MNVVEQWQRNLSVRPNRDGSSELGFIPDIDSQNVLGANLEAVVVAGLGLRFGWFFGRPKVSVGIQDSLDSVGWSGDNSRRGLLAPAARYCEG